MKKLSIFCSILLLLSSCDSKEYTGNTEEKIKQELFTQIYSPKHIPSQTFQIDASIDTVINTDGGTAVKIYSNSFALEGHENLPVEIEIKEAFDPADIALANLTTLTGNQLLESGGMIYINATAGGENLELVDGKEIAIAIPTNQFDPEMKIYFGEEQDNGAINWAAPEETLNEIIVEMEKEMRVVEFITSTPVDRIPKDEYDAMHDAMQHDTIEVGDIVDLEKFDFVAKATRISNKLNQVISTEEGIIVQEIVAGIGQNSFAEDYNTNYIFSTKKLGWANIDRLLNDERTEEIELIIAINGHEEFDYIYTTLIFNERRIYLPGYQKEDGSYSFTHGDYEKTQLPIGEKASILATSYKNGKPFFHLHQFDIQKAQTIEFALSETSLENMQSKIKNEI